MFRLNDSRMALKYRKQGFQKFSGTLKPRGRPSALTPEQDREVIEHIFLKKK